MHPFIIRKPAAMPLAMPVEKGNSQSWLCMGLFHFVCDPTKNEEVHCIVTVHIRNYAGYFYITLKRNV